MACGFGRANQGAPEPTGAKAEPWWNGPAMRCGKNCLPVSVAALAAGRWASTPVGPSSEPNGLYPSMRET